MIYFLWSYRDLKKKHLGIELMLGFANVYFLSYD
jgi:hypothetical protein